jgi:hypothetical protein
MALSRFPGTPDLVISLPMLPRANECRCFWSELPTPEPLERRSSQGTLEFHTPLCHRYENFDIVQFFIYRWPLLLGRQRGSSALG